LGDCLLGQFSLNEQSSPHFWATFFPRLRLCNNFGTDWADPRFGRFFTNSSGRPDRGFAAPLCPYVCLAGCCLRLPNSSFCGFRVGRSVPCHQGDRISFQKTPKLKPKPCSSKKLFHNFICEKRVLKNVGQFCNFEKLAKVKNWPKSRKFAQSGRPACHPTLWPLWF
jgi:hypothetical protein